MSSFWMTEWSTSSSGHFMGLLNNSIFFRIIMPFKSFNPVLTMISSGVLMPLADVTCLSQTHSTVAFCCDQ